jgi:hypothetical protein
LGDDRSKTNWNWKVEKFLDKKSQVQSIPNRCLIYRYIQNQTSTYSKFYNL